MSSHSFKFWLCNLSLFPFECVRGYDDRRHSRIARAPRRCLSRKPTTENLSPCSSMLVYLKLGTVPKTVNGHHRSRASRCFFLFQLEWLGERLWRRLHNINLSRCLWKEMKTRRTEKFHSKVKYFFLHFNGLYIICLRNCSEFSRD